MFSNLACQGTHRPDRHGRRRWLALSDHLGSADTLNKLKAEKWNFVVLQEQANYGQCEGPKTLMYPAARNLGGKAKRTGNDGVLLTWDTGTAGRRRAGKLCGHASKLNTGYEQIANELDVPLARWA